MSSFGDAIQRIWGQTLAEEEFLPAGRLQTTGGEHLFFKNKSMLIRFSDDVANVDGIERDVVVSFGKPMAAVSTDRWHPLLRPMSAGDEWIHLIDVQQPRTDAELDAASERIGMVLDAILAGRPHPYANPTPPDERTLASSRDFFLKNKLRVLRALN